MFYNKLKTDAVAEAVAKIIGVEEELKGNQHKIDANKNNKIDAQDFQILRKKKEMKKEETESVEEGFGEMEKYLKDKRGPQPSGGSGVKKGTRYGGSKQKEEPKEDDDLKSPSRRAKDSAAVLGMKEEVELDEAKKPMSQDEKDKVVTGVQSAMRKSYDNVMAGRAAYAAAKAGAAPKKVQKAKDEKDKVVAGLRAAMRKSYDNEMKGRAAYAAAKAKAARLAKEEVEQLDEVGDTEKGQKLLRMVNKRAVDRLVSKRADTDPAYAKKAQQTHLAADERLKEDVEQVDEVSPPGFKGTVKAMKKHKEIDNPFALAWYMKNKGYKSHKKADGTMKKEEVENEEEDFLDLDEAVSRKHFQQVADVIKAHPDQEKRNELAKHHAEIFKKQNPRFDHGRFYTAAGANIKEEVDSDTRTKDMISGPNKPTKQKDDVGPGADGKSTKVKFRGGPMSGD